MTELRIFSYLPNPPIWKATIAARICGVELEVRGAPPTDVQSWLWVLEGMRNDAPYAQAFAHFDRLRRHPAFAPDVEPYVEKIDRAAS
jgi:hypothetical protein